MAFVIKYNTFDTIDLIEIRASALELTFNLQYTPN